MRDRLHRIGYMVTLGKRWMRMPEKRGELVPEMAALWRYWDGTRMLTHLLTMLCAIALALSFALTPVHADGVDIAELVRLGVAGQLSGGSAMTASGVCAGCVHNFVMAEVEPMARPWVDAARGWAYVRPATGEYFVNYPVAVERAGEVVAEIRTETTTAPASSFVRTWAAYSGYAFRQFMKVAGGSVGNVWAATTMPKVNLEAFMRLNHYYAAQSVPQ
jgi:hypothetical protein